VATIAGRRLRSRGLLGCERLNVKTLNAIQQLKEKKRQSGELTVAPKNTLIHEFIEEEMDRLGTITNITGQARIYIEGNDELTRMFIATVKEEQQCSNPLCREA